MQVTLEQIAEHTGVSRMSVVRALKGHPKVGEATRRRIVEAARELGYSEHSNLAARKLAAHRYQRPFRNGLLAVLGTNAFQADSAPVLPFHAQLFRGMEEGALQCGTEICLCPRQGDELPYPVRTRGVDGVLCIMPMPDVVERIHKLELPCVGVDCHAAASHADVGILPDGYRGLYLATEHLLALGHRRILYLASPWLDPISPDRIAGYRAALGAWNILASELIEEVEIQHCAGGWIDRCLERRGRDAFTGVVCHNDIMAMAAVRRLQERGLRVPEDISVVGFDDVSPAYRFEPALTSISFDRVAMGRWAVELLCRESMGPGLRQELFPVELIVRASTAAPKS